MVPVQVPTTSPAASRIVRRATGERAGLQLAPFRMARLPTVCPATAAQASVAGIGATTDGSAGDEPQQAAATKAMSARSEERSME